MQFIFLAAVVALSACQKNPGGNGSRTFQIPWPGSDGEYQLQEVQIETFDEADRLKGKYAEILVEPSENGKTLIGNKSVGRFSKTASGVLVPMDFNTLQATTIYAHMERLAKLDESLGLTAQGVWPARIGVAVNYPDENGAMEKNQAYFIPDLNSLVFVPYANHALPISMNAGIIAHEHFHQIFQRLVSDRIEAKADRKEFFSKIQACGIAEGEPELPPVFPSAFEGPKTRMVTTREYNFFILRALNEGLADFYGWVYSGDAKFITHSMKWMGEWRSLDKPFDQLGSIEMGMNKVAINSVLKRGVKNAAYDWGSGYARFLRHVARARGDDRAAREDVAKALLRALPKVGEEIDTKFDDQKIDPDLVVLATFEELGVPSAALCELYNQFVVAPRPRPRGCSR
jgi:hypothetical protein